MNIARCKRACRTDCAPNLVHEVQPLSQQPAATWNKQVMNLPTAATQDLKPRGDNSTSINTYKNSEILRFKD